MKKLQLLESLRGVAALVVLFHHVFVIFRPRFAPLRNAVPWFYEVLQFISDLNLLAVLFFFVLSGFVIQLSQQDADFRLPGRVKTYMIKRARRILPLYFLALAVTLLFGFLSDNLSDRSFSGRNLVGNLLFLQTSAAFEESWVIPFGKNGPLWSLSYEVFFYLFFPFFVVAVQWMVNKFNLKDKAVYLAVLSAMAFSFVGFAVRYYIFFPYAAFMTLFVVWYGGAYLALYYKGKADGKAIYIFGCVAIFLVAFNLKFPSDTIKTLIMGFAIVLAGFAFYRLRFIRKSVLVRGLEQLTNKIFFKTGAGSYAIYVLHYPLLLLIKHFCPEIPMYLLLPGVLVFVVLMIRLEEWVTRLVVARRVGYAS